MTKNTKNMKIPVKANTERGFGPVAKKTVRKVVQKRDRQREEDIRVAFHNGMVAGLEEAKRQLSNSKSTQTIQRIQNRVLAHRDMQSHHASRWYTGSCRAAVNRG